MATMTADFTWGPGSEVASDELGVSGTVQQLLIDRDGIQWFDVRWVNADSEFKTYWFRERELRSI